MSEPFPKHAAFLSRYFNHEPQTIRYSLTIIPLIENEGAADLSS